MAMDSAIQQAIAARQCSGGVLWVEHGSASYHRAYGCRALVPAAEPMTEDTIFDTASLSKVIATTPAVMLLVERGQVKLDAPVQTYIPEFAGGGKEAITVRQLLTHTSGLRSGIDPRSDWRGSAAAIQKICGERLQNPPGEVFHYGDLNFILLGEMIQRVARQPLSEFVSAQIYAPLKMKDTGYLPPDAKLARVAPTEIVDGRPLRGVVHDQTARRMGGVAGNGGVFTTAGDLARFARMLLNGGELDGVQLFKPETIRLMTTVQTPENIEAKRGLGWDIDSEYSGPRGDWFSADSYGHTGWTGTSLWIDPASRTFVIFLSNRNHPDGQGDVAELRHRLGTLAAEAAGVEKSRPGK
jgi:CubicO group peptidase (beta-lactamase class C family)